MPLQQTRFMYLTLTSACAQPAVLGELPALHRLTLQGNFLHSLPDAMLRNMTLQYLDVSLNRSFSFAPRGMQTREGSGKGAPVLAGLRTLICGFQGHEDVLDGGEMLLSTRLTALSLHLNNLSYLPQTWGAECSGLSLEKLVLDWNNLTYVPRGICSSALQYLFLAGNQLHELPRCLSGLRHLRIVDCSFNRVAAISPCLVSDMLRASPQLEDLVLYGNPDLVLSHPQPLPPGLELDQALVDALPRGALTQTALARKGCRVRWTEEESDCDAPTGHESKPEAHVTGEVQTRLEVSPHSSNPLHRLFHIHTHTHIDTHRKCLLYHHRTYGRKAAHPRRGWRRRIRSWSRVSFKRP